MAKNIKFFFEIAVHRSEKRFESEKTAVSEGRFFTTSIQAAKAKVTKLANSIELFSWIQSWDNEERRYTGKELRWKNWTIADQFTNDAGTPICVSTKDCIEESGETVYHDREANPYGTSVIYRVRLSLYWKKNEVQENQ